jgi:hypothetical protein
MKAILYNLINRSSAAIIGANAATGEAIVSAVAGVFNLVTMALGTISSKILRALDSNRFEHAKQTFNQYESLAELDLLIKINQVKEDALRQKAWTMYHTIALNRLGSALHANCGWPPARVHAYVKPLIESIPGMVYYSGDEFSDDE